MFFHRDQHNTKRENIPIYYAREPNTLLKTSKYVNSKLKMKKGTFFLLDKINTMVYKQSMMMRGHLKAEPISIAQGTPEWYAARQNRITGSMWFRLSLSKPGLTWINLFRQEARHLPNDAVRRGRELETLVRQAYPEFADTRMWCGTYTTTKGEEVALGYSPDGYSEKHKRLLEVKNTGREAKIRTVQDGQVPEDDMAQMQFGLLVTGAESCCYYVGLEGEEKNKKFSIRKDEGWRARIIDFLEKVPALLKESQLEEQERIEQLEGMDPEDVKKWEAQLLTAGRLKAELKADAEEREAEIEELIEGVPSALLKSRVYTPYGIWGWANSRDVTKYVAVLRELTTNKPELKEEVDGLIKKHTTVGEGGFKRFNVFKGG